ncbi:class I SAM-dependent methyltransferase [Streptomyces sp. BV286]|uniref:class I SAM-dependent methyltransferase n=1 Tax=Streptomyces sp. BV286 TaxID=2849672 RepID=UPI001C2E8F1C|nr:class I SAM-dependent methyltransferase [Streptomyces sp. BV286]MBV1935697.1 class I SAM-dependent methyltransferase [Streptomyces sp. BV286]
MPDAACFTVPSSDAATATLLRQLVLAAGPLNVLQAGCPDESSTARIAAALSENGRGRIMCCETDTVRAEVAAAAVEKAGLGRYAQVRVGSPARLLPTVPGPVDLLLLAGPAESFLPLLGLLEPRMLPGAVVVAHGVRDDPARSADFLAHLRVPGSGYVSLPLPFDGGLEVAVRAA